MASRDSRTNGNLPAKRRPSRSPEGGAPQRKASKPDFTTTSATVANSGARKPSPADQSRRTSLGSSRTQDPRKRPTASDMNDQSSRGSSRSPSILKINTGLKNVYSPQNGSPDKRSAGQQDINDSPLGQSPESASNKGGIDRYAPSDRSTPKNAPQPHRLGPIPPAKSSKKSTEITPASPDVTIEDTEPSLVHRSAEPLFNCLIEMSNSTAEMAAISYAKQQAQASLARTQKEQEASRAQLASVPAVHDRKEQLSQSVQEAARLVEEELRAQRIAQEDVAKTVAASLSRASEVQPAVGTSADSVSRDQYSALAQKNSEAEAQMKAMNEKLVRLSNDFHKDQETNKSIAAKVYELTTQVGQIKNFQSDLAKNANDTAKLTHQVSKTELDLGKNTNDTAKLAYQVSKTLSDLGQHAIDITKLTNQVSRTQSDLAHNANDTLKVTTDHGKTKRKLATLEDACTAMKSDIDGMRANVAKIQQSSSGGDLGQLESKVKANKVELDGINAKLKIKDSVAKKTDAASAAVSADIKALRRDLDNLNTFARGPQDEDVSAPVSSSSSLNMKMSSLNKSLNKFVQQYQGLKEIVVENGKPSLPQRLKRLDFLVNNLVTDVRDESKAPLPQRLSALELDMVKVQEDLQQKQSEERTDSAYGNDFTAVGERLNRYESELNKLSELAKQPSSSTVDQPTGAPAELLIRLQALETKAEVLDMDVNSRDEVYGQIMTQIEQRFQALESGQQSNDMTGLEDVRTSIQHIQEQYDLTIVETDKIKEEVATLRGAHDEIHDNHSASIAELKTSIKSLQETRIVSKTPTSAPQFAAPNMQLTAGFNNPPQINGYGSPYTNSSANGQITPGAVPKMQEQIAYLYSKTDQLTDFFQRIQGQYNNLTTDEIVRCMADQMSSMYPDAKNLQQAVNEVMKVHTKVKDMESKVAQRVQQITTVERMAKNALSLATSGSRDVTELKEEMKKASDLAIASADEVAAINSELGDFKKTSNSKDGAGLSPVEKDRLANLEAHLDKLQKAAVSTRDTVKDHALRLTAMDSETFKQEIDRIVKDQGEKVSNLSEEVRGVIATHEAQQKWIGNASGQLKMIKELQEQGGKPKD